MAVRRLAGAAAADPCREREPEHPPKTLGPTTASKTLPQSPTATTNPSAQPPETPAWTSLVLGTRPILSPAYHRKRQSVVENGGSPPWRADGNRGTPGSRRSAFAPDGSQRGFPVLSRSAYNFTRESANRVPGTRPK
jgi:hypothetical protein